MAPETLHRKLEHLIRYLKELEKFKKFSKAQYIAHPYTIDRLLELIITVEIDIVFHLVAEQEEQTPSTYASAFLRAGELKLLSRPLSKSLSKAAGFRNILAHGYADLDPDIVYSSIKKTLHDATLLIKALKKSR